MGLRNKNAHLAVGVDVSKQAGQSTFDSNFATDRDDVQAFIEGERRADQLLTQIRQSCAVPDGVHDAVCACPAAQLRGFCRTLQKSLESTLGS